MKNRLKEELEKVHCNVCGKDHTKIFRIFDEYTYVKCRSCGLVYQNPRPVFHDIMKRYSKKYFNYELRNESNFFELTRLSLDDIDFFRLNLPGKKFLDIGCATGRLLDYVRARGFKVQGVELCPQSVSYAKRHRGLDIYCGTLEGAGFKSSYFDAINLSHLIEHVPNPENLLLEIRRILKPKGIVMITTPDISGWQAFLFRNSWRFFHKDHIYLFSKKTLHRLLKKTGFKIVGDFSWGGIETGKVSPLIKKIADGFAKKFNVGDVQFCYSMYSASS